MARGERVVAPACGPDGWRNASVIAARGRAWFGGFEACPFVASLRASLDDPVHLTEAFVPLVALGLFDVERSERSVVLEGYRPWLSRLVVRVFAALRAAGRPPSEVSCLARPFTDGATAVARTRDLAVAAMPLLAPWWYDELLVVLGHPLEGAWSKRPLYEPSASGRLVAWLEALPASVIHAARSR
jgi:hypothetical protein